MESKEKKYRVKVVGMLLMNGKMASGNDVVPHAMFENHAELIVNGFIEEYTGDENTPAANLPEPTTREKLAESEGFDIKEATIDEIKAFAEKHEIAYEGTKKADIKPFIVNWLKAE